ncbi:MAG: EipA family protein [Pseudomonadota bacterium]
MRFRSDRTGRAVRSIVRILGTALFLIGVSSTAFAKEGYSAYGDHNRAEREGQPDVYSQKEVMEAGHEFFGSVSGSIAGFIEKVFEKHGQPNGYILGEQGSGAFIAGAKYGEGYLHTRNVGDHKVFWQGPTIGWDFGADGTRVMMLVYNLPSVDSIYRQYNGVNTSAFLVGGIGMTVLENDKTLVVPVKSGVGARLGFNLGYLKFTDQPKWNPF